MPSEVNVLLASVLDSFQCSILYTGGGRSTPPANVAWAAPGVDGALQMGYDGTNAFAQGAELFGVGSAPALASGQAIAYVYVNREVFDNYAGNEHIIQVINQNTTSQLEGFHGYTDGSSVTNALAPPGRASGADWRTDINALRMQVNAYRGSAIPGVFIGQYSGLWLVARVHNRPTCTVTAPSPIAGASVTTTARPNIAWNFSGDGLSQTWYRVRIFTAAQYGIGGFNPQTTPSSVDSGWVNSASQSYQPPSNLVNGTTYRAYVQVAQTLPTSNYRHESVDGTTLATLGSSQYSQFTVTLAAPPVPTAVTPANGATVNTDVPTMGATLGTSSVSGAYVRAEWQLARDAGFTTSVKTLTQDSSEQVLNGTVSKVLPNASELFQGVWYLRARSLDSFGTYSAYTASQSFTVTHPPSAAPQTPSGQVSRVSGNTTFSWVFSDTSPTDFQTAYQIIVERDSDGVQLYDSGKVTSAVGQATINISTAYNDVLLRWKVRVYDSDDVVSAYSATAQWYPRAAPVITFSAPVSPVTQPQPTYAFTLQVGRTIQQYRFITYLQGTSTVVDDSGLKTGSTASYQVQAQLQNNTNYTVVATVIDTGGLDGTNQVNFLAQWVPPASPVASVNASLFDSAAGLIVSWPQNRDGTFYAYRVYWRRTTGDTSWQFTEQITGTAPSTYTSIIYDAPANVPIQVVVTQVAYRFGVLVESAQTTNVVQLTPSSTHYWLIVPAQPAMCVKIARVTQDSFSDEYEQETIRLLNRGRRVEVGTHFGYTGSLGGYLRDDPTTGMTPALQRSALEAVRATSYTVKLRNPFGDVITIAMGDIEWEREAGVGINQYMTFSFEYEQVA